LANFDGNGGLYKAEAPPRLSHELLVRAVAYRMQELALGSLRPEPQRRLRQIAQELKETGTAGIRVRRELTPGTRLMRQWRDCIYEVLVLDDGFSWQGMRTARFRPSRERSPARRGRGRSSLG
jgi:hypothetical protein